MKSLAGPRLSSHLDILAGIAVVFAAVGVMLFYRDFVVVRIGPVPILEILFSIWFLSVLISGSWRRHLQLKALAPAASFALWGCIRLAINFYSQPDFAPNGFSRTAQHCLIFMYPIMWGSAGMWLASFDEASLKKLAYALPFVVAIWPLWGVLNECFGSLLIIPAVVAVVAPETLGKLSKKLGTKPIRVLGLLGIVFVDFPFWQAWTQPMQMQRTLFLMLILMALALPIIYRKPKALILTLGLLLAGFAIENVVTGATVKQNFYKSFQHGEDLPFGGHPGDFQFRSRRLFWTRTFLRWEEHPIEGVGFIEEIPDMFQENTPNVFGAGDFHRAHSPPISGPHNSYLSILARMGLIGMAIFLVMAGSWIKSARFILIRPDLFDLLLLFVVINGAVYAALNIGFESPHNSFFMWLFAGGILGRSKC